jgi:hypothetical protein
VYASRMQDIGESHIERQHQTQARDHQRTFRQRNTTIQKQSKAKHQNMRMNPDIQREQANVEIRSQRKLKKRGAESLSLKEERDSKKKEERASKRLILEAEETANPMAKRVKARYIVKEELKAKGREGDTV